MHDDDRIDVQRQSAFTPEGQIESAGRFARGLGPTRIRRLIGAALIGWFVLAALLVLTAR